MKFSEAYLKKNMMGPNVVTLLDELIEDIDLTHDMRIMDLGCGTGLSSMALAEKTGAQVFAVDLWITATENERRFNDMGLGKSIIPIHADVTAELPFAQEYFDTVFSLGAYHYFGRDPEFMDEKLAPYVKKGGLIALVIPGFNQEIHGNIPKAMLRSWTEKDLETIQTSAYWEAILKQSTLIENLCIREMRSCESSWADWLECDNPYAVSDRVAMEAGAKEYMNMISVTCRRRQ